MEDLAFKKKEKGTHYKRSCTAALGFIGKYYFSFFEGLPLYVLN